MEKILIFGYLIYFLASLFTPKHSLVIEFLDVGFGDSILITTTLDKRILIDGGGNNEVLSYLGEKMPPGFCSLDLVVLSHPHADHLYGLLNVLEYCDVKTVVSNEIDYETDLYGSWKDALLDSGVNVRNLYQGDVLYIENIRFISLWPESNYYSDNINNTSNIILMDVGDVEILLPGDAEIGALSHVDLEEIHRYVDDGVVEIIKVPHHGSSTAMQKNFYSDLNPKYCVISVGENAYGLPSETFIDYLGSLGCKVRRTDFEGTIRVVYNLSE